jgi:hypothetical protein
VSPPAPPGGAVPKHVGVELYVYYRAPADRRAAVQASMHTALAVLMRTRPGLLCRLLLRCDEPVEPAVVAAVQGGARAEADASAAAVPGMDDTWMEIHQRGGGLQPGDIASIRSTLTDLPTTRLGPRHLEWFAALPAPAPIEAD